MCVGGRRGTGIPQETSRTAEQTAWRTETEEDALILGPHLKTTPRCFQTLLQSIYVDIQRGMCLLLVYVRV